MKLYYNDRNHRIKKERFQSDGSTVGETTYYVRDVAGQVLGIYTENTSMSLALRETPPFMGRTASGYTNMGTAVLPQPRVENLVDTLHLIFLHGLGVFRYNA